MAPLFYQRILEALVEAHVECVIVGGIAVNLQGVPRLTADLDIVVSLERGNLAAIGAALGRIGLKPRLPVAVEELADVQRRQDWMENKNLKAFTFQNPNNPLEGVDIVLSSPVSYEELRRTATIIRARGLELRVCSIQNLILMKEAAGRAQDLSDIDALKRVLEVEGE